MLHKMSEDDIFTTQLDQHLNSILELNVDTVFFAIYNTVVEWVHQNYKDVHEYQVAYDKFIKLTRAAIRRNHYHQSPNKTDPSSYAIRYTNPNSRDVTVHLLSVINQMSPETAMSFLSELTAAWCLSCPRENAGEYIKDETISDVDFANGLFSWLLRPFDFFW
jgi:hypothetical protein